MFNAIQIFRINSAWVAPTLADVQAAFEKSPFVGCGPTQKESVGWVAPRGEEHGPLIESINGEWIFKLQSERKAVPASEIKKELKKRCDRIEADTGRKPGRAEKRELKDEIELTLLPRAFSRSGATMAWLDRKNKLLIVAAGSLSASDSLITELLTAFAETKSMLALTTIMTEQSPSTAMVGWLLEHEAPADFSIDRDLELRAADETKASVRYARHSLDNPEVVKQISEGLIPVNLAMTFDDRVSFTLGADMSIKKINLLDTVFEDQSDDEKAADSFDADVTIMTGELARLIPAVLNILGGEVVADDEI